MEIRQILLFLDYVIFRLFGSLSVVQLSIDIVNLTYIVSLGASNLQLAAEFVWRRLHRESLWDGFLAALSCVDWVV
jgi:hypothetical protein